MATINPVSLTPEQEAALRQRAASTAASKWAQGITGTQEEITLLDPTYTRMITDLVRRAEDTVMELDLTIQSLIATDGGTFTKQLRDFDEQLASARQNMIDSFNERGLQTSGLIMEGMQNLENKGLQSRADILGEQNRQLGGLELKKATTLTRKDEDVNALDAEKELKRTMLNKRIDEYRTRQGEDEASEYNRLYGDEYNRLLEIELARYKAETDKEIAAMQAEASRYAADRQAAALNSSTNPYTNNAPSGNGSTVQSLVERAKRYSTYGRAGMMHNYIQQLRNEKYDEETLRQVASALGRGADKWS